MLKILPIVPSQTSQIFDPLFLHHHLLFLLILVIVIVAISDSNVHNTYNDYYTGKLCSMTV